jgi:hypothetical protein
MARIVQTDDDLTVDAPPLRLTFRWDGRRWSHALDVGGRVVASSVEFEPERDDPDRPVSPAYQQLTGQEEPGVARALLVGQWGPHHGSAVFSASDGPEGVVVEADVAVRSRTPLQSLAATYLAGFTSGDLADADPGGVVWDLAGTCSGRLRFEPGGPSCRVSLAEAGRAATRVQASAELAPGAANQRLLYRWVWLPAGTPP